MTLLLGVRPPVAVVLRQPPVRALLVLAVAAPAFTAWWGGADAATLRLRVVGLALAVVVAMVWDDRAAVVVGSTPVGAPAVLRGRAVVLVAAAAAAWVLTAIAVRVVSAPSVPLAGLALEAATVAAVVTAAVGVLTRGRTGEPVLAYPLPVLLGLAVVVVRLPDRWRLFASGPQDPTWPAVQQRWAVLLVVSVLVAAWAGRDPARR